MISLTLDQLDAVNTAVAKSLRDHFRYIPDREDPAIGTRCPFGVSIRVEGPARLITRSTGRTFDSHPRVTCPACHGVGFVGLPTGMRAQREFLEKYGDLLTA